MLPLNARSKSKPYSNEKQEQNNKQNLSRLKAFARSKIGLGVRVDFSCDYPAERGLEDCIIFGIHNTKDFGWYPMLEWHIACPDGHRTRIAVRRNYDFFKVSIAEMLTHANEYVRQMGEKRYAKLHKNSR